MEIDELGYKILAALAADGRVRWSALAERFGVSPPAIAERVRRLEQSGVIEGYIAQMNPEKLGLALTAFVLVTLSHPQYRRSLIDYVERTARIRACHHVAGEGDYLLQVCCRSTAELEHLLSEELKVLPGIERTRTTIVLSTKKETLALPIEPIPQAM